MVPSPGVLYLIDGNSLVFRAYFALPPELATEAGEVTNAVHGFVSMLVGLMRDGEPGGIAVAFDRPEPTFREELVDDYKGQRPPVPEDLVRQFPMVRRVLDALGIPSVDVPGYEADDLLATMATRARDQGRNVVVVTGDRDSFQLVEDPLVKVLYTRKGLSDTVLYDEAGIRERTGVAPSLYPVLAALRGDPSDNLPGVPGVGEKTAAKLVLAYGGLDGIYSHLGELTPKLRASLVAHEGRVRANAAVIPLVRDVQLPDTLGDLRLQAGDPEEARRVFADLELRTLWRRAAPLLGVAAEPAPRRSSSSTSSSGSGSGSASASSSSSRSRSSSASESGQQGGEPAGSYGAIPADLLSRGIPVVPDAVAGFGPEDAAAAAAALREMSAARCPLGLAGAWDGEPGRTNLLGLAAVATSPSPGGPSPGGPAPGGPSPGAANTLPDGDQEMPPAWFAASLLGNAAVKEALEQVVGASGPGVVAHGAKELMRSLLGAGIDVTGLVMDTAVAAYLLDPTAQHDLADLCRRHLGVDIAPGRTGDAAAGRLPLVAPRDAEGMEESGAPAAGTASAAAGALAVEPALRGSLEAAGLARLHDEVERPLVRVLARMEVTGIGVDAGELSKLADDLTGRAAMLEEEVQRLAGVRFNVNSTPQLRSVLYEHLGLSTGKRTKTGYSTDAATLSRLRGDHPVIDALLAYREVEKLRSTYGETLLAEVGSDGRIHATFNQTVTRTGRLSSDRPNLHNIPVRSDEGKRFRRVFVPAPGWRFLVADYDQVELRVIAHLSGDAGLAAAFAEGRDVHRATAARVFGVDPGEVTPEQRSRAKMVAYGLAYGMEAYGLAQRLGISTAEAQPILDAYFVAFPGVRELMERSIADARSKGYTETALGRRRPLPDLESPNRGVRMAAERQAMNAGIQGLAADLFKVALVRLDKVLEGHPSGARLVLQVHDEVIVEAPEDHVDELAGIVPQILEEAGHDAGLSVALRVTCGSGSSWADAKEPGG